MGTLSSPDIYTLSPRASGVYIRQTTHAHGITIKYAHDAQGCAAPEGEYVYIRQSTSACVITTVICYTSSTIKICPNLEFTAQLAYIVTDTDSDRGRYFNIFIRFPNVSIMYPTAVISIIGLYSH